MPPCGDEPAGGRQNGNPRNVPGGAFFAPPGDASRDRTATGSRCRNLQEWNARPRFKGGASFGRGGVSAPIPGQRPDGLGGGPQAGRGDSAELGEGIRACRRWKATKRASRERECAGERARGPPSREGPGASRQGLVAGAPPVPCAPPADQPAGVRGAAPGEPEGGRGQGGLRGAGGPGGGARAALPSVGLPGGPPRPAQPHRARGRGQVDRQLRQGPGAGGAGAEPGGQGARRGAAGAPGAPRGAGARAGAGRPRDGGWPGGAGGRGGRVAPEPARRVGARAPQRDAGTGGRSERSKAGRLPRPAPRGPGAGGAPITGASACPCRPSRR